MTRKTISTSLECEGASANSKFEALNRIAHCVISHRFKSKKVTDKKQRAELAEFEDLVVEKDFAKMFQFVLDRDCDPDWINTLILKLTQKKGA